MARSARRVSSIAVLARSRTCNCSPEPPPGAGSKSLSPLLGMTGRAAELLLYDFVNTRPRCSRPAHGSLVQSSPPSSSPEEGSSSPSRSPRGLGRDCGSSSTSSIAKRVIAFGFDFLSLHACDGSRTQPVVRAVSRRTHLLHLLSTVLARARISLFYTGWGGCRHRRRLALLSYRRCKDAIAVPTGIPQRWRIQGHIQRRR